MRKIILKTALITLGVVIVLAVAAFGIASLCVPAAMSDLTYSLGMEAISSDYAFQEYERSGSLAYLSRSSLPQMREAMKRRLSGSISSMRPTGSASFANSATSRRLPSKWTGKR